MNPELTSVEAANVSALMQKIRAAYQGVPRPQITLSVARGLDDEWRLSPGRFKELNIRDLEHDWIDVTDERMEEHSSYFTFADDEGWRFYLPAYMMMALRTFSIEAFDSAAYQACTMAKPRFGLLDRSQLECAREFQALVNEHLLRTRSLWRKP